jgi:dTMP kinase
LFVSLEGIDGSGKTTQAKRLAEALSDDAVLVREPGGTDAAERVRELLVNPEVELEPLPELLLFCAARAQLVAEVIRPALERGRDVVADRFSDSSIAYQGAGRGLGTAKVEAIVEEATGGLEPDLTILLRISPELAVKRSGGGDRFESEGIEFQRAIARAYDEIAARHPDRVVVIDGEQDMEAVTAEVREVVWQRRDP